MRRALAEAGVPQPRFAALRILSERHRAAAEVGFPAVLKPADSGGQRGIFLVRSVDEIEAHLHEALSASPTREAILEEFVEGTEMNGIVLARDGEAWTLDPLRPAAPAGRRLRRRLDPRVPGDRLRRPARRVGADRGPDRAHARARERHRLPAADRDTGRRGRRGRVCGADSGRADGRSRPPRRRRRPRRGAAADCARRGAARRARLPAVPPAARDPLPDRGARAAADRAASRASARSSRCSRSRASCRPTPT